MAKVSALQTAAVSLLVLQLLQLEAAPLVSARESDQAARRMSFATDEFTRCTVTIQGH
jgi:hypothetical protein